MGTLYVGLLHDASDFVCVCMHTKGNLGIRFISITAPVVRLACNWASEVSPTLRCSIEISHDIYMSVMSKMRRWDYVAHAHARSHFWAVKTVL